MQREDSERKIRSVNVPGSWLFGNVKSIAEVREQARKTRYLKSEMNLETLLPTLQKLKG